MLPIRLHRALVLTHRGGEKRRLSEAAHTIVMIPPTTASGRAMAKGSAWVAFGQIIGALSGLVASILAARVLSPDDFGVMGIALLAIATLNALSQTGFDQALIQRREVDGYIDVGWTVQVWRGLFLCVLVFFAGFFLSDFYDEPQLTGIFAAMSATVLAGGVRNITTVLFHRELEFRTLVMVGVGKAAIKLGVVVALLFTLGSVWALVWGYVAAALADLVLSYWVRPYRPKIVWDVPRAGELLSFGKWISVMSILGLLVTRGDDMFISKYLGMAALGLYGFAYEIANLPATHVTHVVGKVSFPAYARLHDETTRASLRRAFFNVMKATLLITAPLSVVIFLGIEGIVAHVVGPKWEPIIPLVKILVVAGFVRSVAALATGVFHGAGRPHLDFWMNLPRFCLLAVLIWPACALGGLVGASWLALAAVSSCLFTWYVGLRDILKLTPAELLRENLLVLVVSSLLVPCYLVSERLVPPTSGWAFILQGATALILWGLSLSILQSTTRFRLFDEVRALRRALRKSPA